MTFADFLKTIQLSKISFSWTFHWIYFINVPPIIKLENPYKLWKIWNSSGTCFDNLRKLVVQNVHSNSSLDRKTLPNELLLFHSMLYQWFNEILMPKSDFASTVNYMVPPFLKRDIFFPRNPKVTVCYYEYLKWSFTSGQGYTQGQ